MGTAPARSADRAVGAVVAVVAVLLLVGSGRFVAAALVVVTAVAVLQARSLSPRVDRAIGHGIVAVGHAVGRVLSFVLLGALFLVVIVPVWLVGMPFRRRPLGVPRGVHGWVPRAATEAGVGVGVGADEGGDRVAPAVERRAARRAHGHEPGRAPVPWRRALGRVALVARALLALDLALGAVLSGTGLAPGDGLFVTGVLFWQAWFASSGPIWLQRIAVLAHAVSAFVLILAVIVHAYAALWVKGTLGAMVRGRVSVGWAKHHHPLWYREQVQQQTPKAHK